MYIIKYIYVSIDNKYLILIYMYYIILSRKCLGWVYIDGGLFYIILKYWVEIFINRLMGIMSMFIYINFIFIFEYKMNDSCKNIWNDS